ncbi:MAG: hypothetical protein ACLFQV_02590 [Vulcanimicrobiota bacterium]
MLDEYGLEPQQVVHIGDNPYRDFIDVKKLGITTIRIIREDGLYRLSEVPGRYEAGFRINGLNEIYSFFKV